MLVLLRRSMKSELEGSVVLKRVNMMFLTQELNSYTILILIGMDISFRLSLRRGGLRVAPVIQMPGASPSTLREAHVNNMTSLRCPLNESVLLIYSFKSMLDPNQKIHIK